MQRVAGKIAVVTGGLGGIGLAITQRLLEHGATVVIADLDAEKGRATEARLRGEGASVGFVTLDVASEESWRAALAAVVELHGRLDVLVNNAGIGGGFPPTFQAITLEEWHRVMRINLDGVFLGTKHAVLAMKERGTGSIVNIGSVAGYIGTPGGAAYGTSKGGVRTLTKHAAISCARQGLRIRVNSIHPSNIWTPLIGEPAMRQHETVEAAKAAVAARHPFGCIGEPDDVAWLVVYLASEESKLMTGSDLIIDGGLLSQ